MYVFLFHCWWRRCFNNYIHIFKTGHYISNCQRLAFTVCVSQHNYAKVQTCENLSSIGRRNCEIIMKCHTKLCAYRCLISKPHILNLRSRNQTHGKLLLSQKLHYLRGSHCHNVLYYQPLPIICYKERFCAIIINLSNYQYCPMLLSS